MPLRKTQKDGSELDSLLLQPQEKKEISQNNKKTKKKNENLKLKETKTISGTGFNFAFLKRSALLFIKMQMYHPIQIIIFISIMVISVVTSISQQYLFSMVKGIIDEMAKGDTKAAIEKFLYITGFSLIIAVSLITNGFFSTFLKWIWRYNLTESGLKIYFKNNNFYNLLNYKEASVDNPDQRLTKDILDFCEIFGEVFCTLLQSIIGICISVTFLIVEKAHPTVYIIPFTFPPITSLITFVINPFISMWSYKLSQAEGNFRYAHSRIREYAEPLAFYRGEKTEKKNVNGIFSTLIKVATYLSFFSLVLNSYMSFIQMIPTSLLIGLVGTLIYFDVPPFTPNMTPAERGSNLILIYQKAVLLLNSVLGVINLLITVGPIMGYIHRIGILYEGCYLASKESKKFNNSIENNDDEINFENVSIETPNGKLLHQNLNIQIEEGKSLIIMGPSGCGKSSIVRVLSGIWGFRFGRIQRPTNVGKDGIYFLSQKPYLITGDLRQQILYPFTQKELEKKKEYNYGLDVTDDKIIEALKFANIDYILKRAKQIDSKSIEWDRELSLGEKQRVQFARLFFHKPKFAILDESSSALDSENEEIVYSNCKKLGITMVSVAHRHSVKKYHEYVLEVAQNNPDGWNVRKISEKEKEKEKYNWELKKEHIVDQKIDEFELLYKDSCTDDESKYGDAGSGLNIKTFFRLIKMLFFIYFKNFNLWVWVATVIPVILVTIYGLTNFPLLMAQYYLMSPANNKQIGLFYTMIGGFLIAFIIYSVFSGIVKFGFQILGVLLRNHLTKKIHKLYFLDSLFYKVNKLDNQIDNSDQRITVDVGEFSNGIRPFGFAKILQTLLETIFTFISSLFSSVSKSIFAPIPTIVCSGVIVVVEFIIMTFVIKFQYRQARREGFFRFSLARLKEYSEQIALYKGIKKESEIIRKKFKLVYKNQFYFYIAQSCLTSFNGLMASLGSNIALLFMIVLFLFGFFKDKARLGQQMLELQNSVSTVFQTTIALMALGSQISKNWGFMARIDNLIDGLKYLKPRFNSNDNNYYFTERGSEELDNLETTTVGSTVLSEAKNLIQNGDIENDFEIDQNLTSAEDFQTENGQMYLASEASSYKFEPSTQEEIQKEIDPTSDTISAFGGSNVINTNFGGINSTTGNVELVNYSNSIIFDGLEEINPQSINLQSIKKIDKNNDNLVFHSNIVDENGNKIDEKIVFNNINVVVPDGSKTLLENLNIEFKYGRSLLINGKSGCGKSSLLRLLAKLWPIFQGKLDFHHFENYKVGKNGIFFLSQSTYMCLGTLRDNIIYPDTIPKCNDENLLGILNTVNLGYIFERIGSSWEIVKEWGTVLSPGEQQRLGFARLLYHQPHFAILDESTSALDKENEELMYNICRNASISVISVGHRETLHAFHSDLLTYDGNKGWKYFQKGIGIKKIKNEDKNMKNKVGYNNLIQTIETEPEKETEIETETESEHEHESEPQLIYQYQNQNQNQNQLNQQQDQLIQQQDQQNNSAQLVGFVNTPIYNGDQNLEDPSQGSIQF